LTDKRKPRVPGTVRQEPVSEPGLPIAMRLSFRPIMGGVEKFDTPQGEITVLNFISANGMNIAIELDEDSSNQLVNQIKGFDVVTKPSLIVP